MMVQGLQWSLDARYLSALARRGVAAFKVDHSKADRRQHSRASPEDSLYCQILSVSSPLASERSTVHLVHRLLRMTIDLIVEATTWTTPRVRATQAGGRVTQLLTNHTLLTAFMSGDATVRDKIAAGRTRLRPRASHNKLATPASSNHPPNPAQTDKTSHP